MLFDGRLSRKYLPCRDALEDLHDTSWRELGMCTAEKVYMILIHAHHLNLDLVSLLDTGSCFSYDLHNLFIQQRLSGTSREIRYGNESAMHNGILF